MSAKHTIGGDIYHRAVHDKDLGLRLYATSTHFTPGHVYTSWQLPGNDGDEEDLSASSDDVPQLDDYRKPNGDPDLERFNAARAEARHDFRASDAFLATARARGWL